LKRTYTSEREVKRAAVFSRVVKGGWTLLEAAERMEVSYRQAKRLGNGVPQALYTDWRNVHVREPNASQRVRGEAPVRQFARMCEWLGRGIVAVSSPQAKGRVERNHGPPQDRW
jgi:ATP-dependent RNA circularization protein (DNA/RNA ligase family)